MTVSLIIVVLLLGALGFFAFQSFSTNRDDGIEEEIDLVFDAEGPYALLFPRRDGNALILNLKRTASYERINYELAYTSSVDETIVEGKRISEDEEGSGSGVIDRGVVGTIDTKDKKGEYEQEILFGSCSKNICKYDQGVENGTLILKVKKGSKTYRMVTQWHLQKPDIALGELTSLDNHFNFKLPEDQNLSLIGFTIINDLTGVPKLPSGKQVLGKVYSLNVPLAKTLPSGDISLELAETPPDGAKLYKFDGNSWQELETKIEGSKLSAKSDSAGIFAVLIPKK